MATATPVRLRIVYASFCTTMAGWINGNGRQGPCGLQGLKHSGSGPSQRGLPAPRADRGQFLEWAKFACASASGDGFSRGLPRRHIGGLGVTVLPPSPGSAVGHPFNPLLSVLCQTPT